MSQPLPGPFAVIRSSCQVFTCELKMLRFALVFLLLCIATRGEDATYLVLMTARNGDGGVVIQLHTADDRYEEKVVTGQTLSAEYGETSAQLTLVAPASAVSSSEPTGRPYVAILPFNGSLGLLKFHVGRLSESKLYTINLTNKYNCSLAAVFRIQDEHFSLPCYNSEIGRLTFLQLNLDTDILSNSAVPDLQYPSLSHLRNLTNFVHVELPNNTGHLIYFGTGSEVLYYKPLDFIVGVVDARLDEHKCFITKLSYTGGWEMLAYCADGRTMYINTATEDVFYTATLARDGQPYVCPDLNIFLSVHSDKGYIQYGLRSTKEGQKFTAQLDNVYDGVCLESSEQTTLFVFADRERGTRLLDVSGNYIESLSNSTCTSSPCQPLVFLDNCYLALREQTERGGWHILLFDTHHNFSLALDVSHTQADLMAVIKVPWTDEPKVTDGVANPEVMTDLPREVATDSTTSSPGASDGITLIASVVVAVVVVAIFVAIGVAVVIWKGRSKDEKDPQPVAEEGQSVQEKEVPQALQEAQQVVHQEVPQAQPTGHLDPQSSIQESCKAVYRDDDSLASTEMRLGEERASHEAHKKAQTHL